MRKVCNVIYRTAVVATLPIHALVEAGHSLEKARLFKKKRHAKVAIGVVIMMSSSALATHPVSAVPHFLWDAACYLLHGYGSLPVVKVLCERLNLESLEEENERN